MMIRGTRGKTRESMAAKKLSTYFELLSSVGRSFFSFEISVRIYPEIPHERFIHRQSTLPLGGYSELNVLRRLR